jgi:D-arginine dehydrogenase
MIADLAIVGSGIMGSFVAYEAGCLRPDWDIVVLDKGAVAGGTTTWSAGVSFPITPTQEHRELARLSAERFAGLSQGCGGAFIRPVPMVYVLGRDRIASFQEQVQVPLRPLSGVGQARIREMLPDVVVGPDEEFVTHDGDGFAVRARPLADYLLADLITRGCLRVETGQHVSEVSQDRDGYRLTTGTVEWQARRVVFATGPWPLPSGLVLPSEPRARVKQVTALQVRLPVRVRDPLVYFIDDDLFVLPMAAGSALVSFRSDVWDTTPDAMDGRLDEPDRRHGSAVLASRSAIAASAVTGGRAFCDLYTPQRLPQVRTAPGLPGLAVVLGGSGSGVRLAPGLAAQAVRALDTEHDSAHVPADL